MTKQFHEQWITSREYPMYEVSWTGKVRNKETKYVLKGNLDKQGYHRLCVRQNKKAKSVFAHRMVAKEWIPNPENKPQVNHKNFRKDDNNISNLEWVTGQENHHHKMEGGRNVTLQGSEHGCAILNEDEVLQIVKNSNSLSRRKQAELYGVSLSTIYSILAGRNWSHLTGIKHTQINPKEND